MTSSALSGPSDSRPASTPTGSLPLNCAFDFFPSSFSTSGKALMGLNAANEGFLRAFLRYGQLPRCVAHVRSQGEADTFAQLVAEVCGPQQSVGHVRPDEPVGLEQVGALLHPFPGFGHLAWNRNFHSPSAYSLLGITHTTATQPVMDSIGNLAITPIHSWDAVVCTSQAVRHTYETVLGFWEDHLRQRLGASRLPRPQLPIIPLGVDTSQITPATPERRRQLRQQLGIPAEAFVVLWVGRFNHTAKAHPIPSYLALEQLARSLAATGPQGGDGGSQAPGNPREVVFLQSGWFGNDTIQEAFHAAAHRWAPTVRHLFVDGRQPAVRQHIWQAADVFLSLSDNLQETFGLTPIEAMAAELPVVVSDWDGYRDTVRDGLDGFRVATSMPAAGLGGDLARTFCAQTLSYDAYCGISCHSVAVDVAQTARVLEDLARHPELRSRLGRNGRRRALDTYEWAVVISQYRQLLAELADRRSAARQEAERQVLAGPQTAPPQASAQAASDASHRTEAAPPSVPAPLRADPYAIFASYPSVSLQPSTRLRLVAPAPPIAAAPQAAAAPSAIAAALEPLQARLAELHADRLFSFANPWRLPLAQCQRLLALVAAQPDLSLAELAAQLELPASGSAFNRLVASVGWLQKVGMLELG